MFKYFSLTEASRSPLLSEALKMHDVMADAVPKATMRLANDRCLNCESKDACFAWLAGAANAEDYRWFCPNARLFDDLSDAA
tara:strand:+ start:233 stop:478 length:246 start_codon:yes stop_codon:yes gene_type:complete